MIGPLTLISNERAVEGISNSTCTPSDQLSHEHLRIGMVRKINILPRPVDRKEIPLPVSGRFQRRAGQPNTSMSLILRENSCATHAKTGFLSGGTALFVARAMMINDPVTSRPDPTSRAPSLQSPPQSRRAYWQRRFFLLRTPWR
jgi:hypothetical protein